METDDPPVVVRDLRKRYGGVTAVDGVGFEVERGSVVGLLGPNGAGKTTTIKSLLGLVVPDEGSVRVCGVDVLAHPRAAYRRVGAMLEGARNVYWRLTVRENLSFFAALGGLNPAERRDRHDDLLEGLGLAARADDPVNDLSLGMKQKVSLACTLARDAEVAVLDEPTLGLDVESSLELRRELRRLAERESVTVLLSSHDMNVVEDVCDRVVVLSDGRVVADDRVEDLVELFHTRAYRVSVAAPVSGEARRRLADAHGATRFRRAADRLSFEVAASGDGFYELMDDLRSLDLELVGVQSLEPDFEDVFVRIVEEGRR